MVRNQNLVAAPGTAMRLGVVHTTLGANNLESHNIEIIILLRVLNILYYDTTVLQIIY